jgi:NitT/TauT family transport system substrate-binding protein
MCCGLPAADNENRARCGRGGQGGLRRGCFHIVIVLLALMAPPAQADEQVKIGIGFGLAFLPIYICEDLKLVEKYGKEQHLAVRASYERFLGADAVQDAITSRAIDMGPFGVAPLLTAWEKGKETKDARRQILAVSGMTTMPLVLLSNERRIRTIADLRPSDRIAMPTLTAPQMYLLGMQSEKVLGQYDRLRDRVIVLSHADAVAALFGGEGSADAYFSSPPYTQIALKDSKVHRILDSEAVIGGKVSFLIIGATKSYIEAHPKVPGIIDKAMDEAARIVRDDPRRAAQIYLEHEPSRALDATDVEAVLRENKDQFGSAIEGTQAFADFMGRHGELKAPPQSWKEIVAPSLLNSPST